MARFSVGGNINSAIQLIKANARGFRNFTNYARKDSVSLWQVELGDDLENHSEFNEAPKKLIQPLAA